MCGIVGIIKFDGININESELKIFNDSLNHRGPDDRNIYLDKSSNIGLGHTRTSIFDISNNGRQPMSYADNRYFITFNGEIYNFIEVREELKSLGHHFRSESDTEVILAAYTQWGENCQFKFNGDWAFAIWDNKEKILFVSRDRFGAKPFYYIQNSKYFIFASELKAFMSLRKNFRPQIDEGFVLQIGKNYGALNTILKNVYLLQPGFQIVINLKNKKPFSKKKWWRTIDHRVEVQKKYNDQVEEFKELFFNACKLRLRSDVPIAASLSGGVDSSAVCSTIEQIKKYADTERISTDKNLNVFFCEFSDDKFSEKKFAVDLVNNKNINFNYINLDKSSFSVEELNQLQFDNEWIDPDKIQLSAMYKKMREKGFRVSLDGNTADELFGGYWEDPIVAMMDEVRIFGKNSKRFFDLIEIRKSIGASNTSEYKLRIRKLLGIKNYNKLALFVQKLKNRDYFTEDSYDLYKKTDTIYSEEDDIKQLNSFDSYLYRQFHYFGAPYFLKTWDNLSMAHGVLSRTPFVDVNLVNYIFSLQSNSKIGNGYTKRILRDSMIDLIPKSVLFRKDKKGFRAPPDWFDKNIKKYLLDSINDSSFLNCHFFDGKKIKKDYEKNPKKITTKKLFKYVQSIKLVNSFNKINKF